jgi:two-component system, LuxR family, response regulator FixJ
VGDDRHLIFVVEDDQAVRDALQFALRLEGFCVHAHDGGAALLADPSLDQASCIILDDRMRPMDGFALLNSLGNLNAALPAIMLTSHATPTVKAQADAAGVRRLLEKPLLYDALVADLRNILSEDWFETSAGGNGLVSSG